MQIRRGVWGRVGASVVMVAALTVSVVDRPLERRSLPEVIAAGMEGAQLDVWGGGPPAPGGTTSLFVHHGSRAAELYWTSDGWCLARVFSWSVVAAQSPSAFRVRYEAQQTYDECVVDADRTVVLSVFEARHDGAAVTWRGQYAGARPEWTVRTRCSVRWDEAAPCGFADAAAVLPSL